MALHLLLRLEAPLMSFGTLAIDAQRPVQRWPAVSMLTGLLANALGWQRTDAVALERLQARICWAARVDRPGDPLHDFQTAQLEPDDLGWTTHGVPEGRAGGGAKNGPPHIRRREFRADASVAVALRLDPAEEAPTLHDLAAAVHRPRRPLFIGRKSCLPSVPLRVGPGLIEAGDALQALASVPAADAAVQRPAVFFNQGARVPGIATAVHRAHDERRFSLDVHAGHQMVYEWLRDSPPAS